MQEDKLGDKEMKLTAKNSSKSGKTFYYYVNVPAGVVTVKEGVFCGSSYKETAEIGEILWTYCFGKKYFSITNNGKNKLEDFKKYIEKYAEK